MRAERTFGRRFASIRHPIPTELPQFRHLGASLLAYPPVGNAKATASGRKGTVPAEVMRNAG